LAAVILSSDILVNLAAWTAKNMLSVADPRMTPPPSFFIRNLGGRFKAIEDQSTTIF
jgi:hypothetical protein